jgi:hypothetical protein
LTELFGYSLVVVQILGTKPLVLLWLLFVNWTYPLFFDQRSHHRSCVMWLRREPNNRSKPTHLKSFSATQRQSPSESEDFSVLIQPNF